MQTTIEHQSKMEKGSKDWFAASFEGVNVPDAVKKAAERICHAYGIWGLSDAGYIANVINAELLKTTL